MSARAAGPSPIRAFAPAKVNLTLAILGRRPDGFHDVDTWMLALSLADEVVVEARPERTGLELSVDGPAASADVRADATNLVWRAADAVLAAARARRLAAAESGWSVRLRKEIPSQSGLGGASSDAAATVIALERALGLDLGDARATILSALGSDCAFFASEGAGLARCRGRGELVSDFARSAPAWHLAVWVPQARCPTADVYRAFATARGASSSVTPERAARHVDHAAVWSAKSARELRELLFNDLEPAALAVAPELARWRALFDELGHGHVRLSGSGSAWFALCDSADDAERVRRDVDDRARVLGLGLRASSILVPRGTSANLAKS